MDFPPGLTGRGPDSPRCSYGHRSEDLLGAPGARSCVSASGLRNGRNSFLARKRETSERAKPTGDKHKEHEERKEHKDRQAQTKGSGATWRSVQPSHRLFVFFVLFVFRRNFALS